MINNNIVSALQDVTPWGLMMQPLRTDRDSDVDKTVEISGPVFHPSEEYHLYGGNSPVFGWRRGCSDMDCDVLRRYEKKPYHHV